MAEVLGFLALAPVGVLAPDADVDPASAFGAAEAAAVVSVPVPVLKVEAAAPLAEAFGHGFSAVAPTAMAAAGGAAPASDGAAGAADEAAASAAGAAGASAAGAAASAAGAAGAAATGFAFPSNLSTQKLLPPPALAKTIHSPRGCMNTGVYSWAATAPNKQKEACV